MTTRTISPAGILLTALLLGGCGVVATPNLSGNSYVSAQGESAAVQRIEVARPDGSGIGSFVSVIDPTVRMADGAPQNYRVSVVFDSGNQTTVVQDGRYPLAVGQRVLLQGGQAVPTDRPDKPHLAPTPAF